MTTRARILILLAVVGSILAVGAAPASACSCAQMSAAELLEIADAAFIGTAVAVDDQGSASSGDHDRFISGGSTYRFEVEQVVKGELPASIEVATPPDAGACGASFPLDRRSAVLVHHDGDGWTTTLCMAVTESQLLRASPEEPRPPTDGAGLATVPNADGQDGPAGRLTGLVIVAAAGLGAWFLARALRARTRSDAPR
jgi:hypothetical protein